MQELLDKLDICPVFTAHPTEAKRVTLRRVLGRMRETLQALDRRDLLRRQREDLLQRLQADLMCFWETETVRPLKPSVLDEVARTLYVAGTLWQVVPQLFRDLRTALRRNYGDFPFRVRRFVRFGTWIGGDRDGNPFVTAEVTRQTLELLRGDALRRHLEACRDLENRLSLSDRYHTAETPVAAAVRKLRQAVSRNRSRPWPAAIPASPIASGSWPSACGWKRRCEGARQTRVPDRGRHAERAGCPIAVPRNSPPTCN